MFLRLYKDKREITHFNRVISKFNLEGMSSDPQNSRLIYREMIEVHKKNHCDIMKHPKMLLYYIKRILDVYLLP